MKSFTLAHLLSTLLSVCLTLTRISAFAASANLGYISVIIKTVSPWLNKHWLVCRSRQTVHCSKDGSNKWNGFSEFVRLRDRCLLIYWDCCSLSVLCSMEIVWHGKFNQLFATFPHLWQLKPTDGVVQQATVFNDSAKVRFLCKVTIPFQLVYWTEHCLKSGGVTRGPQ